MLPPHNGTHAGLAETDGAIIDPGAALFVHLALLCVQRAYDRQSFTLPACQGILIFTRMALNHCVNVLQIVAEVVELLSLGLFDAPLGLPAALGKSVVLLFCHDAVGSDLLAVCESCCVQCVYDLFGILPGFVQQGCIRWKPYRLRRARRVQHVFQMNICYTSKYKGNAT